MSQFKYSSQIPAPAREVFRWHLRGGALRRLIPPWLNIDIVSDDGVVEGGKTDLRMSAGPARMRWLAEHVEVQTDRLFFKDRQARGPFGEWEHIHSVRRDDDHTSTLEDDIRYELPFWSLGSGLADRYVRRNLDRQFRYRHHTLRNDLELHRKYAPERPLRIAISGSNGLIGSQLVSFLAAGGHEIHRLVRQAPPEESGDIFWDYQQDAVDLDKLDGVDIVIHLAGESVLSPRWSRQKKLEIIGSRVRGTEHLARALASLAHPPRAFLSASAVGYYGNRTAETLDESSPPGDDGFLSAICQDWERAGVHAAEAGIRTVQMRIGIVLSPQGGILNPLIIPFRLGIGGRYGGRNQYLSWIGLDDVLGAIYHLMADETIEGPVNLTSPNPVTMTEFARTLGGVVSRPNYVKMPPWLVRLLLGQVTDDAALMSVRAVPRRLEQSGYVFLHPDLDGMLRHVLGRA